MSSELMERAAALAAELRAYGKDLDRLRKALDAIADPATWGKRAVRSRALHAVESAAGLVMPDVVSFVAPLREGIEVWVGAQRRGFLDRLVAAASEAKLDCRELGQAPPVLDVAGIEVSVDFDREEATLGYGREPLAKTPLEPRAILEGRRAQVVRLKESFPGPGDFFDAVAAAYRARAGREAKPLGARVDLVDLVPELVIEYESRGWLRNRVPGKAELAYGLDRLARDGQLEKDGQRLELGTATGGSTRDKKRVVFLQAGLGGGQYYLTARIVPGETR